MKCARCKTPKASNTWTLWVCADGRKRRVRRLCDRCDVRLNALILRYFGDPAASSKIAEYASNG